MPTNENFIIKQQPAKNDKNSPFSLSANDNKSKSSINQKSSKLSNSVISDYTEKYAKEISEKLDMLEKINKEQVRHNDVSEKFFVACLEMMGQIARNNGKSNISSQIDQMVQMVTQ